MWNFVLKIIFICANDVSNQKENFEGLCLYNVLSLSSAILNYVSSVMIEGCLRP